MAEHRETLSEDVGGTLLLASTLAVFGVLALVLMPLGAAFAPTGPATGRHLHRYASGNSGRERGKLDGDLGACHRVGRRSAGRRRGLGRRGAQGPPPVIGTIFPGLIMLVVAAILARLSGLLLGYAKARSDEIRTTDPSTPQ